MKPRPGGLRWVYAAIAILGTAAAVVWVGLRGVRGDSFPRQAAEFLPAQAIDRRLQAWAPVLEADPQNIRGLTESGVLHFQKGKDFYPDAINELADAIRLGALDPRIFYFLGVMYQEEGFYPQAVLEYEKFLRNRPEDRDARLVLAKLLYQSGRYDEALGHYRRLHDLTPRDPFVVENLGLTLASLKRTEEARELFEALFALGPNEARRAHFYLGRSAAEGRDDQKAKEHYLAVMPEAPDLEIPLAVVHVAMAANYERLKSPILAKEHWEKALRYDPQNTLAKKSLQSINTAIKRASRIRSAKKKKT